MQERLEEERVAPGRLAAGCGELGRHGHPQGLLAQPRRRPGAQRSRAEDGCLGAAGEPSQISRDVLSAAGGNENGESEAVDPRGQVVEKSHRFGVGPVDVVDRKRNGTFVGDVVEQPVEAVLDGEGAVGRKGLLQQVS